MSTILEALVQAQLERQSRGVPGLHTVQVLPRRRPPPRRQWPVLVAGAAGLGVFAAVAWMQLWPRAAIEVPTPVAAIAAPDLAVRPAVVSVALPPPAADVRPLPQLQPEADTAMPVEIRRKPLRKVRKGRAAASVRAAAPVRQLYGIGELPAPLQKVARSISIAGFAHLENPRERTAIINDRALREGEELPGGLRVERIAGDGVIFSLKGYRFRKGRT